MASALWMRERIELIREMKASPSHLKEGECDYAPPLELVGIYITQAIIAKMAKEGKLKPATGAYLSAALGCHTFCIVHHCTHESLSQHNPEHAKFENAVFRLGSTLILLDDGYREAHRAHHARCNEHDDPDMLLSHTSLPVLGDLLFNLALARKSFLSVGAPLTVGQVSLAHKLGLTKAVAHPWLVDKLGMVNWDNVTLKMAAFGALEVLEENPEYVDVERALNVTWRGGTAASYMLLALFFARYPHRNAGPLKNEVDSFYDATFKAQNQVDLWMMGEGAHHMHHAKSDVSYSRLPAVCKEVEERRPDLKVATRGTEDVLRLEHVHELPPKQAESAVHMDLFSKRTAAILESKDQLATDPQAAVARVAGVVLDNALHCCLTADRTLLQQIHSEMKLDHTRGKEDRNSCVPMATWDTTIFADETAADLEAMASDIRSDVLAAAAGVGARMPCMATEEALKENYLGFYQALVDEMIPLEQQAKLLERLAEKFPEGTSSCKSQSQPTNTFREFLESPIPDNFMRNRRENHSDKMKTCRQVGVLLTDLRSRL